MRGRGWGRGVEWKRYGRVLGDALEGKFPFFMYQVQTFELLR